MEITKLNDKELIRFKHPGRGRWYIGMVLAMYERWEKFSPPQIMFRDKCDKYRERLILIDHQPILTKDNNYKFTKFTNRHEAIQKYFKLAYMFKYKSNQMHTEIMMGASPFILP
jgi:hypothetical protein